MSATDRKPRRRWLQFGLRTALLLVVVAALGLGWWSDRAERDRRIERLEMLLEAHMLLQPPGSSDEIQRSWQRAEAERELSASGGYPVETLPEFDRAVLVAARARLSRMGLSPVVKNDEAVQELIGILADADPQRRAQAARTLAVFGAGAAPAVGELQRLLQDPEPSVRWHALGALGSIGPDAAPAADAVRKLMDDDDSNMSAFAAQMLLQIDPGAEIGERLAMLLVHRDANTRRRALLALTHLENDSGRAAVPAMVALLEDDDKSTRMAAIEAVAELAPRQVALEAITAQFRREDEEEVRRLAAAHLIRLEAQGETDE